MYVMTNFNELGLITYISPMFTQNKPHQPSSYILRIIFQKNHYAVRIIYDKIVTSYKLHMIKS